VKFLIFDFDGTIADSFDAVLAISNRLADEFGYPKTSLEEAQQLKNMDSREILRLSGVSFFQVPFLLRRLRGEMNGEICNLQPIPGIPEALVQLKQEGHQLGIVTSNSRENVLAFLKAQNIEGLFSFVSSGLTIFGKGRLIRRVIRQYHIDPAIVFYVGDETRDIEAARKIRVRAIAVSWGFNSRPLLESKHPDFLVNQPSELVQILLG
jgi:phosphoglycolate phosphatase-like HAD superfamily hydrolase